MRIAVVGGEGYLGAHVCKYFNADSFSRKNGFDVTMPINGTFDDYDVILHMAAKVDKSGEDDDEVFRVNSFGTKNLVSSLNKDQIFIFASTKEVYTPENDSYSASKLEAEEHVKEYSQKIGFKLGIFRLASVYAPDTNGGTFVNYFVDSVMNDKTLTLMMKGEQMRDFLYVDDLSRAFEKFINSSITRAIYDIGGGKANSSIIRGLANRIGKILGKSPKFEFSEAMPKGNPHYVTNIDKIKRDLNWEPKISLDEGLRKIISLKK